MTGRAVVLFTDFGAADPYAGQIRLAIRRIAPACPVIDLCNNAPASDPKRAAYLLAAYVDEIAAGDVALAVVDPGVGTARRPVVLRADERWFVGPDNGLLALVLRRAGHAEAWTIGRKPARLSASFHGRDLFAPVAALLAHAPAENHAVVDSFAGMPIDPPSLARPEWPDDLAEVVYIDHYGNAMTGIRAASLGNAAQLRAGNRILPRRRVFAEGNPGEAFWYENSNGLVEIACNGGGAAAMLGMKIGSTIEVGRERAWGIG